ncbi:TonB-dependent receptor [Burkholderia sp. Ac-20379]|uniref:TonB-dependent receptor n=1 Tax=Burkholderia sp. Ac-20379 TaxID=2703900 RepID=UPI00197D6BBF|nr:TonB-dependent siderophore receptor [Burkholderia sp. Ac-20379]MBN3725998.1 TonB-dependent siderophore receptor [Burkholderia sp. Ac-20379]
MPHRGNSHTLSRRTASARAAEALFVALMGAAALQNAQAQSAPATTAAQQAAPAAGDASQPVTAALPAVSIKAKAAPGELPAPYAGGQLARGGSVGVLGTANVMNQPFSTTNYTEELIRDTQARTIADVVVNNASVRAEQSSGGFGDVFQIRGFDVQATDVALNGLYGMVSAARVPVNMLERVEVLEGPGSLAYGMGPGGSVGGAINIVSKRADDTPLTRLTALYQTKGQFGVAADIGRRFGSEGQFGVRFNGQIKDGQTGIAHGNQLQGDSAIGLDYRGKQLRWSFDAYNVSENTDDLRSQIGFGSATTVPAVPSAYSTLFPGAQLKLRDTALMTRAEYDINQYVTVYGAAGEHYGTSAQNFPYASNLTSTGAFDVVNGYYDQYTRTKTVDAGFRFHFDTFGIKHTLVTGVTSLNQEIGYFYAYGVNSVASNLYNPVPLPSVGLPRGDMQRSSQTHLNSQQVIDTMSFFNDRVLLTGGFRRQTVGQDNYDPTSGALQSTIDQQAITPLAGFVVKPLSNISVYGNFTSGLSISNPAPVGSANVGQAFAPYKSNQYEAGVKADWGRVMTQAAIFQISQPNAVTDPVTNIYSYNGMTRVRGLELSAYGQVTRDLRLMASATFYDPKVSGSAGGTQDGNVAGGVPKFAFNLAADYDLPWVPGLSVNGRIIHTGAQYYDSSDALRLPAWTRYDVGLRYATRIASKDVVLRANVENIFGSRYWMQQGTYVTNAAPRTLLLSAQFDF